MCKEAKKNASGLAVLYSCSALVKINTFKKKYILNMESRNWEQEEQQGKEKLGREDEKRECRGQETMGRGQRNTSILMEY